MTRQTLKSPNGRMLGYIDTQSNGEMLAKLPTRRTVGKYDPKRDKTYLPTGREFGKGNLLSALIMQGSA